MSVPSEQIDADMIPALAARYAADYSNDQLGIANIPAVYTERRFAANVTVAQSYLLPSGTETAVLSSRPLSRDVWDSLTLPYSEVVVWFGTPLRVPDRHAPDLTDLIARNLCCSNAHRRSHKCPVLLQGIVAASLAARYAPERVRVEGVMLLADGGGTPRDEIIWLLAVDLPGALRPYRLAVPASRSHADWSSVLQLLTAAVAWGDWQPAPPLQPPTDVQRHQPAPPDAHPASPHTTHHRPTPPSSDQTAYTDQTRVYTLPPSSNSPFGMANVCVFGPGECRRRPPRTAPRPRTGQVAQPGQPELSSQVAANWETRGAG